MVRMRYIDNLSDQIETTIPSRKIESELLHFN